MQHFEGLTTRYLAATCFAAVTAVLGGGPALAQELVLSAGVDQGSSPLPRPVIVFPDIGSGLPTPARTYIVPAAPHLDPHGLALVAANRALVTRVSQSTVDLIDTANGTLVDSLILPDAVPSGHHDGLGTLEPNPARTLVLALTSVNALWVIAAPFDHTATVTTLALPSSGSTLQTRAIAVDGATGRAFLALQTGIAVVDPPYTSIAFTIPSANGNSQITGAIALSPDGSTLAVTRGVGGPTFGNDVRIFHTPFTAASVADTLVIAGSHLDGLKFAPDGNKLLIVDQPSQTPPALNRVYAVSAPYSSASSVATLAFDTGPSHNGFEDIDISADGQLAALSGGSLGTADPLVLLRAPFTAAGFSFTLIDIPQFHAPYTDAGRGAGTARFWSTAIAALPPQVWVDRSVTDEGTAARIPEGNSGTTDVQLPINLAAPSSQTVTVDYTTVDGTTVGIIVGATAADNDYIPASGTLTFAPGETQKNLVVKVVGDTTYEHDERFKVVISNPVNASLLGTLPGFADTATVTILNDEAAVPVAITTTAIPDGVTGVPYFFQLTGTGAHPLTWSIPFTNIPPNLLPAGLSLNPATGAISGTPTTPITLLEDIKLTDPIGLFAEKTLSFTITGAGIPVLTLAPSTLDFGSQTVGTTSSSRTMFVTNTGSANLVLGTPFMTAVSGDFVLALSSCTNGQTLLPGAQCQLNFRFAPQSVGTHTFNVDFTSNAAPATLTLTGVGTGGALPVASIANAPSVVEGSSGTRPMTFPVTLSATSAGTVTVQYAATGGTATSGTDYNVSGSGTLTFAPGVTAMNVVVNVVGDTQVEPDETVIITLSSPSGATLGTATATGIIVNDDAASPPVLALLSGTPDFGNQVLGTTSAAHTVTIGNTGGANLVLATPFASLPAGADFAYASGANACVAGATLTPAAACNLYITFTPLALGSRSSSIVLASDAPPVTLVLSGVGVPAQTPSDVRPVPTLSKWALGLLCLMMMGAVAAKRRLTFLKGKRVNQ